MFHPLPLLWCKSCEGIVLRKRFELSYKIVTGFKQHLNEIKSRERDEFEQAF